MEKKHFAHREIAELLESIKDERRRLDIVISESQESDDLETQLEVAFDVGEQLARLSVIEKRIENMNAAFQHYENTSKQ